MLIGELSKRCGLSRDTIRFYEKNGLITVGKRERRMNNYKEYSEETLLRLINISHIKGFGFTLNEVSELLSMIEVKAATCAYMLEHFEEKINRVDQKINELIFIRNLLLEGQKNCEASCCSEPGLESNCAIIIAQS